MIRKYAKSDFIEKVFDIKTCRCAECEWEKNNSKNIHGEEKK